MLIRSVSGLFLIFFFLLFYYFKLDYILLGLLYLFVFFDLFKSKILSSIELIFFFPLIFFLIFISTIFDIVNFSLILIIFLFLYSLIFQFMLNKCFSLLLIFYIFNLYSLNQFNNEYFYGLILLSFINDTFAYLFGNYIKGPLIVPNISPKKTWSGTLLSSFLTFLILIYFDFELFFSIILSSSFFLSDIYFSFIKRKFCIKDFSNLIPGHGGILDRLDSIFIPTLLMYFISINNVT